MKVLMLWEYYEDYLDYFYKKNPDCLNLPFREHSKRIFDDHYGWSADMSVYMNRMGIETEFFIGNNEELQKQWALENGVNHYSNSNWKQEIVFNQIRQFKPDILWIPGLFDYFGDFIRLIKPYCKKTILWLASPYPQNVDLDGISTLITSHPNTTFIEKQDLFEDVIFTFPGFNKRILKKVGNVEKKYDLTFIGGLSLDHIDRLESLSFLLENGINLKVFGRTQIPSKSITPRRLLETYRYLINKLDARGALRLIAPEIFDSSYRKISVIKKLHHGEVFGLDMYKLLAQSRITLNFHIDFVGKYAGNMRMYEATGMGSCLLTDSLRHRIQTNSYVPDTKLFTSGKEILEFDSKEDLLDILRNIDFKSKEIEQISEAGQNRTLSEYSIEKMFENIKGVFE